jgi:hypothetical protein
MTQGGSYEREAVQPSLSTTRIALPHLPVSPYEGYYLDALFVCLFYKLSDN